MSFQQPSIFLKLPTEILLAILEIVGTQALARLVQTCRIFNILAKEFAWSYYLRANPRQTLSLEQTHSSLSASERVEFHTLTDRAWSERKYTAQALCAAWPHKVHPVMALGEARLIVGAGHIIHTFTFGSPIHGGPSQVVREFSLSLRKSNGRDGRWDITGLVLLPDGGQDRTLCVSCADGTITRLQLPRLFSNTPYLTRTAIYHHPRNLPVRSLAIHGTNVLSLSSTGLAFLFSSNSPWAQPSNLQLDTLQGWVAHLSRGGTYAAFGVSGVTPVSIHPVLSTGLSPHASSFLLGGNLRSTSVYALGSYLPGASDQILVSGWFDGKVRVHDLRSASRGPNPYSLNPSTYLHPVMTLWDPLRRGDSIYSVSAGGGSSTHITAGSSRHSVVCIWDVRSPSQTWDDTHKGRNSMQRNWRDPPPKSGWSIYAPGSDNSPVYSLSTESSRVWGCTESRIFLLDFGATVRQDSSSPSLQAVHYDHENPLQ